jgi:hypothetical protein
MHAGEAVHLDLSVDVTDGDYSEATLQAAMDKRLVGRIKPETIVFDQILPAHAHPLAHLIASIAPSPCGYVEAAGL